VDGALGFVLRQPDFVLSAVDPLHLPADVDLAAQEVDVGDLQAVESGQYPIVAYSEYLATAGIKPSTGAVGSSHDNAIAE